MDYDSQQSSGNKHASSFEQRYSLLYSTGARLGTMGRGYYILNAGYEWASVDTSLDFGGQNGSQSLSRNAGHILFNGELLYDPAELPVRLKAYSRDMTRPWFEKTTEAYTLAGIEPLFEPGFNTGVRSGLNINTGFTLIVGVKSGMSNGYFAIFKDLPRIFVDYWDNIYRDTSAEAGVDTHDRKLAVVLNKKDNWLHYRRTTHDDFLQPAQSSDDQRIIIGQIDEGLDRRWVDLTNWIKISADGTFIRHTDGVGLLTNETDVNFMTILSREKWQARTINSYVRSQGSDGSYTSSSRNPVNVRGIWGSNADWLTRFSYNVDRTAYSPTSKSDTTDTYGSVQVTTFKRSNFTLTTMAGLESFEQNQDKSLISEVRVESASTRRFSDNLRLIGSYDLKWMRSEGSANGDSVVQTATASATYQVSNRVTADASQEFNIGSGSRNTGSGTISVTPQTADSRFGILSNSYVRSFSRLRVSWAPTERVQVLTMASQDYVVQSGGEADTLTTATSIVSYRRPNLDASMEFRYSRMTGRMDNEQILSRGTLKYAISRATAFALRADYSYDQTADSPANSSLTVEQTLGHTYFSYRGQGRKLVELLETLQYFQVEGGQSETRKTAKLNAKYFPTRNLFLAGFLAYSWHSYYGDSTELTGNGEIGLDYNKLQASLSYTYGRRDGQSFDNRIDKRFAANLRKQF